LVWVDTDFFVIVVFGVVLDVVLRDDFVDEDVGADVGADEDEDADVDVGLSEALFLVVFTFAVLPPASTWVVVFFEVVDDFDVVCCLEVLDDEGDEGDEVEESVDEGEEEIFPDLPEVAAVVWFGKDDVVDVEVDDVVVDCGDDVDCDVGEDDAGIVDSEGGDVNMSCANVFICIINKGCW